MSVLEHVSGGASMLDIDTGVEVGIHIGKAFVFQLRQKKDLIL